LTQYGTTVQVVVGTSRTHSWETIRQVVYGTWQQRCSVTSRQRRHLITWHRSSGTNRQVVYGTYRHFTSGTV
jgi:hypothetical protein